MKKIFLSAILITFFMVGSAFAGDYYTEGVNCFYRGKFILATQNLEHAVRISPRNVNARYFLAQSYLEQNMIEEAENQYERIILMSPNSNAALLSQKGIYLIQQAYRDKAKPTVKNIGGDNYLAYVISPDEAIRRWASFPVRVYIEPKREKSLALAACEQWEQKVPAVKFAFVSSPSNAQIIIKFLDKLENTSTRDSYIAGFSKPYYQGDNIVRSEIQILAIDPDTRQPLSNDFVEFSVLHEMGHSLGFKGHSQNSSDVMYGHASEAKTKLTQRDINTMKMLYGYDRKTLIAKIKGFGDVRLKEALEYVKQSPNKSVGWENLGDVYRERKQYQQAIANYKKAISIEPGKAEPYNLLGMTYSSIGDANNAYINLKRACDLDRHNIYYVTQFAQVCSIIGKKSVGSEYVNNYIKANPSAAFDPKLKQIRTSL